MLHDKDSSLNQRPGDQPQSEGNFGRTYFPNLPKEVRNLPFETQAWLQYHLDLQAEKQRQIEHEKAKRKAIQDILETNRKAKTSMRDKRIEDSFHETVRKRLNEEGR